MACQNKEINPVSFTEDFGFEMDLCPRPTNDVSVCEETLPDNKLEVELELQKNPPATDGDVCGDEVCGPADAADAAGECMDECR